MKEIVIIKNDNSVYYASLIRHNPLMISSFSIFYTDLSVINEKTFYETSSKYLALKCLFFLFILKCWVNLLTSDSVEYTSSSIWRHGSNFLTALIWPSRESFVRIAQNIPTSLVVHSTFYLVGKLAIKGGATQRRSHVLFVLLYELYQYILKVKSLKHFLPKYTNSLVNATF